MNKISIEKMKSKLEACRSKQDYMIFAQVYSLVTSKISHLKDNPRLASYIVFNDNLLIENNRLKEEIKILNEGKI